MAAMRFRNTGVSCAQAAKANCLRFSRFWFVAIIIWSSWGEASSDSDNDSFESYQYCIVGAGPGGLQIGSLMQTANRSYVILERNSRAGQTFRRFPRHRKLISINKRNTGRSDRTFNERHDWNSLLSDDPDLRFPGAYSEDYWPHADDLVSA